MAGGARPVRGGWRYVSRFGLLLLAALVLAAASSWLIPGQGKTPPLLVVPEEALDFGEVWEQGYFLWNLPIRNPGKEDVHVLDFPGSCACTQAIPESLVLPAGSTTTVQMRFDLRRRGSGDPSPAVREFGTEIIPVIEQAPPGAVRWRISGQVRPYPVVPSVDYVDFGESLVRGSPFPCELVDLHCLQPVAAFAVDYNSQALEVEVLPSEDPLHFQLKVRPSEGLSPGDHDFDVKLKPKLRDKAAGHNLPPLTLKVSAPVENDVYVAPSVVCLGAVDVGSIAEDTVLVGSRRAQPFTVIDIKRVPENSLAVEPAGVSSELGHVFRVIQRVTEPSEHRGAVDFVVREEGSAETYSIRLIVSYRGLRN